MKKKIKDVKMTKHRWYLIIEIIYEDDTKDEYRVSADSALTGGDGLWFGTREEYDEALEEALL